METVGDAAVITEIGEEGSEVAGEESVTVTVMETELGELGA
jgi:hypothetical protein